MGGRPGTDRPGHGALSGRRFGADVPRVPDHLAAGRLDWCRNGSIDAVLAIRREADLHEACQGGDAVRGIGSTVGGARLEDGITHGALVGVGAQGDVGQEGQDRKSVGWGTSVSIRGNLGGSRGSKKKRKETEKK